MGDIYFVLFFQSFWQTAECVDFLEQRNAMPPTLTADKSKQVSLSHLLSCLDDHSERKGFVERAWNLSVFTNRRPIVNDHMEYVTRAPRIWSGGWRCTSGATRTGFSKMLGGRQYNYGSRCCILFSVVIFQRSLVSFFLSLLSLFLSSLIFFLIFIVLYIFNFSRLFFVCFVLFFCFSHCYLGDSGWKFVEILSGYLMHSF